jgi:hypothetical protein
MPGGSGTTGLAASLRVRLRGVTKDVNMTVTTAEVPEFLADNPYYLPAAMPVKKTTKKKPLTPADVCCRFLQNEQLCEMYPDWANLATIYLLYTTCSAECERGVSVLSLVKTAKRNLLVQATLEQLMMIKIQGPSLPALDWEAAAVLFFSKQNRRAVVDAKYSRGPAYTYKWGDVYGKEEEVEGEEKKAASEGEGEEEKEPQKKDKKKKREKKDKAKEKEDKKKQKEDKKKENDEKKEKVADIKSRIFSGDNPDGSKSVNEAKAKGNEDRKRKREEEKVSNKAAYDALDAAGKDASDKKKAKEKEDKKAEKAAKKQKLDNSVVTSRSRVSAPSQAQLQAIQNQIFEKELSGQNQGKASKK